MMQQQTVVTSTGPIQPVYSNQPYQTTSVISSYRHGQSTLSGALLIIAGTLSVIFCIAEIAVLSPNASLRVAIEAMAFSIGCGVLVSILLYSCSTLYSKVQLGPNLARAVCLSRKLYDTIRYGRFTCAQKLTRWSA